jgi:hypothetical protein
LYVVNLSQIQIFIVYIFILRFSNQQHLSINI